MMHLAIFWPNWIGDAVMATPAFRALRLRYPDANFVHVVRPYVAAVLDGLPKTESRIALDATTLGDRGWWRTSRRLKQHRVDMAVLFPNSFRSALVAYLGGCKERIGFARYGRGPMLTRVLEAARDASGKYTPSPVIDSYNALALAAGCDKTDYRMELGTTGADEECADRFWNQHALDTSNRVVCLNPGAAFGSAKFWPAEYFIEVGRELTRRGHRVLVLCGPAERDLARRIAADIPDACSLADAPLSLGLTKACIRRSCLLVTTDSGPRHFAAAFGRPVVTLFGPTHIAWTETYYESAIHLQKQVSCGPCQLRACPLDHRCMKELLPGDVLQASMQLLQLRQVA